jgi:hypothetical protein
MKVLHFKLFIDLNGFKKQSKITMEIRQQSGVYMKQPLMKLATMLRISR